MLQLETDMQSKNKETLIKFGLRSSIEPTFYSHVPSPSIALLPLRATNHSLKSIVDRFISREAKIVKKIIAVNQEVEKDELVSFFIFL
jgi:hypothetical protein